MWNVIEEAVISVVIVILVQFCLLLQPLKILELHCVILTSDLALRTLLIFNFKDIVVFWCWWQRWTAVVDCLNIFSRFIARVFWKFLKVISMTVVPTLGYVSNFFTICSFYMYFSKSCIHPFKRYVGMLKVKRGHVNIFFFLAVCVKCYQAKFHHDTLNSNSYCLSEHDANLSCWCSWCFRRWTTS